VESIIGWDWANDPLALGTWCIFRPGQLAQVLPDLRTTEGRLFFAGGDSAIAWRSSGVSCEPDDVSQNRRGQHL
jgi:monoamine oxidase